VILYTFFAALAPMQNPTALARRTADAGWGGIWSIRTSFYRSSSSPRIIRSGRSGPRSRSSRWQAPAGSPRGTPSSTPAASTRS